MDLRTIWQILSRHVPIVVAGSIATLLVAIVLMSAVGPDYESRASVLLITPTQTESPEGEIVERNPLENPTAVAATANALVNVLESVAIQDQLVDGGLDSDPTVTLDEEGEGSILSIRVVGSSAEAAEDDIVLVLDMLRAQLQDIQERAGIAESTWISAEVLSGPNAAVTLSGSRSRVLIISLVLGAAATFAAAWFADRLYGDRHVVKEWLDRKRAEGGLAPHGEDATQEDHQNVEQSDAGSTERERSQTEVPAGRDPVTQPSTRSGALIDWGKDGGLHQPLRSTEPGAPNSDENSSLKEVLDELGIPDRREAGSQQEEDPQGRSSAS